MNLQNVHHFLITITVRMRVGLIGEGHELLLTQRRDIS